MKIKHTILIGSLLFVSVSLIAQDKTQPPAKPSAPIAAPDKTATPSQPKMDEKSAAAAAEKAWMEYATPGSMHKILMADEGDWSEEMTFWMAPGAPPTKAKAEFTSKSILDGRFQESLHKGEMMGMPFEGRSIVGYNNATKMFESTWIDNMSTGVIFMKGTYDEKKNCINYTGKETDPETKKEIPVREVFTITDDNTRKLEMWHTKNGKESKMMEITMTRR